MYIYEFTVDEANFHDPVCPGAVSLVELIDRPMRHPEVNRLAVPC